MTRQLCTVDAELSLNDAAERMHLNRIRHLAVTEGGEIRGVVSNRDLGMAAGMPGVDPSKTPVSVAVVGVAHTVPSDTTIDVVAAVMEQHRYGSVVVSEDGKPAGIFTTVDALRVLRQLVSGKPAERLSPPTHVAPDPSTDPEHKTRARTAALLRTHHATPSPNDGRFGS